MPEQLKRPLYPLRFDIVETTLTKANQKNIHIGNSGGKFEYIEGSDTFQQHFAPDGSWNPAQSAREQIKHATLYPAVLWQFIQWQSALPESDTRSKVPHISGSTNERMSELRKKLLGDAYSYQRLENAQDETKPKFNYQIDISKIRNNQELLQKLEKFYDRALSANYETSNKPPEPGEVPSVTFSATDFT
jgi:hypothetical protein